MIESETFNLTNGTKAKLPRLVFSTFQEMKETILGKEYELSVNFVDEEHIRKLNREFRNIDKATDILSFPLSDQSGEIYINLEETKKEALNFDRTFENFLPFLFIHGLIHLKGYDHGSRMEEIEQKFRAQFKI